MAMSRGWVFALTIAIGLPVAATDLGGLLDRWVAEALVVVWCWGLFLHDHVTADRRRRIEMWTVLAFACLLYTSPSPRDYAASRMPSSA